MPAVVIVGAQWGDEGKGKITDYLAQHADTVVRYQGGNNAGHTIVVGTSTYKFHLIPSGMLYEDKVCILGNGVVIDPEELSNELDGLERHGVNIDRLYISDQAHLILPTHKQIDQQSEARRGDQQIGTTGRGIGPAYRDKVNRLGIRVCDAAFPEVLRRKVEAHLVEHLPEIGSSTWTAESLTQTIRKYFVRLERHVRPTSVLINETLDRSGRVLFEGAQGTLLDIDHGTYPYVTSSSPVAGGACIGAGVGPTRINVVAGVAKAYTTRVGAGPFPTELNDELGEDLRRRGHEYGTTTGRERRCGWLDLVALRHAVRVNGLTHLAITKLDVLDEYSELKLCTGYRYRGALLQDFPAHEEVLREVEPIYESVPGWKAPTTHARSFRELPPAAIAYVTRIEEALRVPVAIVSVGADRTATFSRLAIWEP